MAAQYALGEVNPTQKVMSGPRGILSKVDNGTAVPVGIFNSCSYGLVYDAQPVFILGAMAPVEIDYTAAEAVNISCSGWRVIGHGAHVAAGMPALQDLMGAGYMVLQLTDRQTGLVVAKFRNVRPVSYSTGLSNRNLQEITINFIGIYVDDESVTNTEAVGAATLP